MSETWELRVDRNDLSTTAIGDGVDLAADIGAGQVLFAVDSFAMTANNVTYAVMGDTMGYWSFFPTIDGWGIVPVWGYADVVASAHAGIAEDDRFYGYWPGASHLVVDATRVSGGGFTDGAAHRASLPAVYNQYVRAAVNSGHPPERESVNSLFRPLFTTSFFIDDHLDDNGFFGAERVAISSASSKTGFALAFCLHRRGVPAIGLTSGGNIHFVEGLGWYDRVVTYEDVGSIADGPPLAYVDMAGDADLRAAIHNGGADLRASVMVGATHWDATGGPDTLPGPTPELFFAPTQIAKRVKEWGRGDVDERVAASWDAFVEKVDELVTVARVQGPKAAEAAYLAALDGSADPAIGVIVEP